MQKKQQKAKKTKKLRPPRKQKGGREDAENMQIKCKSGGKRKKNKLSSKAGQKKNPRPSRTKKKQ